MKIILSTHAWSTGPGQELKKYLLCKKAEKLFFLSHPLRYHARLNGSGFELYENGQLVKESHRRHKKLPQIPTYLSHFAANIYYALKDNGKYDAYIGFDCLNALAGWLLKKLGKVEKCVYYVVDYTPQRFDNQFLNWVYHTIESFCALHCDQVWDLSPRMADAREKFKHIEKGSYKFRQIVPMGIWFGEIKRCKFTAVKKHQAVFMGNLLKKHGVQHVLEAIPIITKSIPDFRLLVIGDGEYLGELKKISKDLGVDGHVTFTGFVEDPIEVANMIARCALALALYESGDPLRNFTYYADPGKLKVYLGAGVPVLLTDVPPNAKDIAQKKCGKIISPGKESIAAAVVELMQDEKILRLYRKNAVDYAQQFDWNKIFGKSFKSLF